MRQLLEAVLARARAVAYDRAGETARSWREAYPLRSVVASRARYFPTELAEALGMLHVAGPAGLAAADVAFADEPGHAGVHRFQVPADPEAPDAVQTWQRELERMSVVLEAASGRRLTPIYLRAALHLLERQRSLIERLVALRRLRPQELTLGESAVLLAAGDTLPRREHVELLAAACDALEAASGRADPDRRAVLVALGGCQPAPEALDELERDGLLVVDHDLFLGARVAAVPRPDGPAMRVLAETYVRGAAGQASPYNPRRSRAAAVLERARRHGAGVVFLALPAGDGPAACEAEAIEQALAANQVAHCRLLPEPPAVQACLAPAELALSGS